MKINNRQKSTVNSRRIASEESVINRHSSRFIVYCSFLVTLLLFSCDNKGYQPKPRGYFRIDLPERQYVSLDTMRYYSFEYPSHCLITPDYHSPNEKDWINIEYPKNKATVHISYKTVDDNLDVYLEDSYSMMTKHISRVMGIRDSIIINYDRDVYGLVYFLEGEGVASSLQFYLTDSINHFLRGSLYFNVKTNNDSLAPVIDYITDDIRHLIETVEWK